MIEDAEVNNPTDFSVELYEFYTRDSEKRLEFADSYAHAGLKSLFLVNGAAIISLLTFIGNNKIGFEKNGLFWASIWFSSGLAAALMSYFGAYFCQNYFMLASAKWAWNAKVGSENVKADSDHNKEMRTGNNWIAFAILSALLSFAFFLAGAFVALFAIT